ncbi:MAG: Mur ligase family protein [Traorella sp.]
MMILAILLWNFMSVEDILYFQNIRYQKDRYIEIMGVDRIDIFHISILTICILFLFQFQLNILYYLIIMMLLPSVYCQAKEYYFQLKITKRIIRLMMYIIFIDLLFVIISFIFELWMQLFFLFMIYFHKDIFYLFILISDPLEKKIRQSFVDKAKCKLSKYHGIIIGITGSYGKTSIKNLVYDVLSMKYLCLKTRASYNNQMGITKTILEELDHQEVFICEMGADHLHEIEDLCHFVSPTIGIVSSIGPQHLSTFKSMDNILHEKMQLLEYLDENGMGFYNFDNFYLHEYEMNLRCDLQRIGIHSYADIKATHVVCNHQGSYFEVELDGQTIPFTTNLLGEHNIINCLFAIACGKYLHVDIVLIQMAIQCAKAVEHRMELKPFYKGYCIDNAYNSNPESAKAALNVLQMMPKRHFIITPGFIDLGENHAYYSEEFGKQMVFCDKVILIKECKDIKKGLYSNGYLKDDVYLVSSMKDALILASTLIQENDTLLIENDIPEILKNINSSDA